MRLLIFKSAESLTLIVQIPMNPIKDVESFVRIEHERLVYTIIMAKFLNLVKLKRHLYVYRFVLQ